MIDDRRSTETGVWKLENRIEAFPRERLMKTCLLKNWAAKIWGNTRNQLTHFLLHTVKEYYVLFDNATEEKDYLHLLFFQLSVIMIFAEQLFFLTEYGNNPKFPKQTMC